MRIMVQLEVESLPEGRLLAFHQVIGEATLDDRKFEVTRSISGLNFGFHEEVDGLTVTHTLNINAAIQAALEAIAEGEKGRDVVPGSEEDLIGREKGL